MNCCKICHFCYNRDLSRCPFLSSLCKYLLAKFAIFAKFVIVLIASYQHALFCHLIWIFGQTFDEFCSPPPPFLLKFAFSQYFPLCHPPHFRFCQSVDGFLANSPFSQICHFRESRHCHYACFVVSFKFFARPSMNPLPNSQNMPFP